LHRFDLTAIEDILETVAFIVPMLDTGRWILVAGLWVLDAGYLLHTGIGYWGLGSGYQMFIDLASG
jgi:hypothetical protein